MDPTNSTKTTSSDTSARLEPQGRPPAHLDARLTNRRIAKNAVALTGARGVTVVIALVITAYLTRVLSPQYFGILGFGTAVLSYFSLLVKFGFNTLGAREAARQPEEIQQLASRITSLKLFLCVPGYVAFLLVVMLLPKDLLVKQVLAVQGLLLFGLAVSLEWVYQGVQRMGVLAVRNVAAALVHVGAVVLLVHDPSDVLLAAAASVSAVVIANVWILVTYTRDFGRLKLRIEPREWILLLRPALPIAASSFMIAVYYHLDQVMIGLMKGETEVGFYTAGYLLLAATLVPAQIINLVFFPSLSAAYGHPNEMRERATLFARCMAALGFPVAVGGVVLAGPLLIAFAGDAYLPGIGAYTLLMVNAGLVYINMTFGQPLIAWNRQRVYFWAVGAGAVANVVLNALLIPSFGIEGAAAATVLSECTVLIGLVYLHWKAVRALYLATWVRAALAAAIGVGGVIVGLQAVGVTPLWAGLASVGAYAVVAWVLRVVEPKAILETLRPNREE